MGKNEEETTKEGIVEDEKGNSHRKQIEKLEAEKLEIEIYNLTKPWWHKDNWLRPRVIIPIIIVAGTYLLNMEYIHAKLDLETVQLERNKIQLEEVRDTLQAKNDSIDYAIKENEQLLDLTKDSLVDVRQDYNKLIIEADSLKFSNKNLKTSNKSLKLMIAANETLISRQNSYQVMYREKIRVDSLAWNLSQLFGMYYSILNVWEENQSYNGRPSISFIQERIDRLNGEIFNNQYTRDDKIYRTNKELQRQWKIYKPILVEVNTLILSEEPFEANKYWRKTNDGANTFRKLRINHCTINKTNLEIECRD